MQEQAAHEAFPPGFRWGIKQGFVRYIARMSDGVCSVTDGADTIGRQFFFSPAAKHNDPAGRSESLAFTGDVRFSGHHGLLFVRVADPHLAVADGTAVLSVVDYLGGQPGKRLNLVTARVVFAVNSATPTGTLIGTDVRLTADGTELFNNVYPEGEPFDDFEAFAADLKGLNP